MMYEQILILKVTFLFRLQKVNFKLRKFKEKVENIYHVEIDDYNFPDSTRRGNKWKTGTQRRLQVALTFIPFS